MRISQDIIEKKLAEVPEEIRAQVTSDEVAEMLAKIAQEHGLHIDQAGILDEETLYVMLGLENTSGFVNRVAATLGTSEAQAESIVKDINDRIFVSIRTALQEPVAEGVVADTRDSILAEIENPTPTIHPISAADQTIAGPAMSREVISTPVMQPTPAIISKPPSTNDFLTSKLSAPTNTPTQTVTDKVPMPSTKPKSYATDPYREPIA